jgi:hypothetical protein
LAALTQSTVCKLTPDGELRKYEVAMTCRCEISTLHSNYIRARHLIIRS